MDAIKNKKKKVKKVKHINEERVRLFAILGCLILLAVTLCGLIFRACTRENRVSPYGSPDPAYDDAPAILMYSF